MQILAGSLITAGFALLGVLAVAEDEVSLRWWILGWGAVLSGLMLFIFPPVWRAFSSRRAARASQIAQEEAARSAYRPPSTSPVQYMEGSWWLVGYRGSRSGPRVRCQVFDPLGRTPSREFLEVVSNVDQAIILRYPHDFSEISRPLPTGEHVVVWSIDTQEGGCEDARTSFHVANDAADLAELRRDLTELRADGEQLLAALPDRRDPAKLDPRISAFFQTVRAYLENSPHLGAAEWGRLGTAVMHEKLSLLETAQIEIERTLEHLDAILERFDLSNAED
jgi:hypothetical protein